MRFAAVGRLRVELSGMEFVELLYHRIGGVRSE